MAKHFVSVQYALNENFNLPTRLFLAKDSCGNYTGVVKHHQIAGIYQVQYFRKLAMARVSRWTIQT